MAYSVKEIIESNSKEIKEHLTEIKADVKEAKTAITFQNGRVRKLEDWSVEAKGLIEGNGDIISTYKVDKARMWTAISVLTILGGTIITLTVMAINSKIKEGINEALAQYNIEIK